MLQTVYPKLRLNLKEEKDFFCKSFAIAEMKALDEDGGVTVRVKYPMTNKKVFSDASIYFWSILLWDLQKGLVQLWAKQTAPIVNKHYENEVTLR